MKKTRSPQIWFLSCLVLLALAVTTIAIIPTWRQKARDFLTPETRVILAKINGDLTGKGPKVTVLKIQTRDSLILEIYNDDEPGNSTLMARIPLPEKRDAYFQLKGNATNLALADIDNDGNLEIIAPAFDEQMVARMNIYKYNSATRSFTRVDSTTPPDL